MTSANKVLNTDLQYIILATLLNSSYFWVSPLLARTSFTKYCPQRITILTSSEADLLKEVDDGVLLELLPPRPRVRVDVVAQAAAVEVICNGRRGRDG